MEFLDYNTVTFSVLGDLTSGLYGSTQFLTDHNVRVIAVGIDKDPHYEFLQSIASYRDVSNVFSVNSENLLDAAPYMYRDVCNSELVLSFRPVFLFLENVRCEPSNKEQCEL